MNRIRMIRRSIIAAVAVAHIGPATAATVKGIQLKGPGQVEIAFDSKVDPNSVKIEYVRDIVQLNLHGATIYPAKIIPATDSDIKKVFAYQYNPKLVRCRLSVSNDAENYKDRIQLKVNGSRVLVSLAQTQAAAVSTEAAAEKSESKGLTKESESLLSRVLGGGESKKEEKNTEKSEKKEASAQTEKAEKKETQPTLTSNKPAPNPLRSFGWLGVVLAGFLGIAIVIKKAQKNSGALSKALGRWTGKQFGASEKMIDVVASHYLGPKKSIAVVRIKGRHLVVGISDESINLIAQLGSEEEAGAWLEGEAAFGQALESQSVIQASKPEPQPPIQMRRAPEVPNQVPSRPTSSAREAIRKRLAGMKTL